MLGFVDDMEREKHEDLGKTSDVWRVYLKK